MWTLIIVIILLIIIRPIYKRYSYSLHNKTLYLKQSDDYCWNLNDTIKHFNTLSNSRKIKVHGPLKLEILKIKLGVELIFERAERRQYWVTQMNIWSKKRNEEYNNSKWMPTNEWCVASALEALCQMGFDGEEDKIDKFLNSLPDDEIIKHEVYRNLKGKVSKD
jgi:hypothetical protein